MCLDLSVSEIVRYKCLRKHRWDEAQIEELTAAVYWKVTRLMNDNYTGLVCTRNAMGHTHFQPLIGHRLEEMTRKADKSTHTDTGMGTRRL